MGATREDEGSGKDGKRRRAHRNHVLKFLRRLSHSCVVCNRLASHVHIGGLVMRYESWKFAQNDGRFWEGCNLFSRLFWVHCEPGVDDAQWSTKGSLMASCCWKLKAFHMTCMDRRQAWNFEATLECNPRQQLLTTLLFETKTLDILHGRKLKTQCWGEKTWIWSCENNSNAWWVLMDAKFAKKKCIRDHQHYRRHERKVVNK